MAYLSDEKLLEIRNAANIVDIVSERVVLKPAGKDLVGLCPFHSEKSPSFAVSPAKQLFYCFGCGAGGDVFGFLMKHDGMGFMEAVSAVALRYGIDIPAGGAGVGRRKTLSERQQLLDLNRQALAFFQSQLAHAVLGETARDYLRRRGVDQKTIDAFGLGFAPEGWDGLTRFFQQRHVPNTLAEAGGLVIAGKNNRFYDRFRNRIIFPILDVSREIIGFGGRVMDDAKPKYLNSPETLLYSKSRSLYGVHAARNLARETGCIYIVEGYFDLLAMHQHGLTNTVATLGTALTADHIRLLKRGFAQKAVLLFDSDAAGMKAAGRSVSLFINEAMDANVMVLPNGYDPDAYLLEFGREAFDRLAHQARGMVDFLAASAIAAHGLTLEGKIRVIAEMAGPLGDIYDPVARSIYIHHLSERLGVDEAVVVEKVRAAGAHAQPLPSGATPSPAEPNRMEKQIVHMMLKAPGILPEIERRQVLAYFGDPRLTAIAGLILSDAAVVRGDFAGFMNRLTSPEDQRLVASLVMSDECWDEGSCDRLLRQFINSRSRRQGGLLTRIKAAENSNDEALLFELLRQKQAQRARC